MAPALPEPGPPDSEAELLARAHALAGRRLGQLALDAGLVLPDRLTRAKGLIGRLVERRLGAPRSVRAAPDFAALGIEVKTIPVGRDGWPRESTFVSAAPLAALARLSWAQSAIRAKLSRVLWIPVEAEPELPLEARRLGTPLLWSPTAEEEAALAADFEELAELVAEGLHDAVTGHRGRALQLRPKAQDPRARVRGIAEGGVVAWSSPRAFYLRRSFTGALLARHFALPPRVTSRGRRGSSASPS